jgi:hypothetical protein
LKTCARAFGSLSVELALFLTESSA